MAQNIMHGARAQLLIEGKVVGLFSQVSYGVNYDAQPSYILGRHSAAEITYTGQEPISISATGFKVVDKGAFVSAGVPQLNELMTFVDLKLSIFDRLTNKEIMTCYEVKPVSFSTGLAARSISDFQVSFLATRLSEDNLSGNEGTGASEIPS